MTVLLLIVISVLLLRFVIGGDEDIWICNDRGQWVTHGHPSYPSPMVSCSHPSLPTNKTVCLAQGGVWRKQGPEPVETCNRKAIDRGNLCRDNSECEGMCQVDLTQEELRQGMRGEIKTKKKFGQCSVWVVELGCYGMMEKGNMQVLCVD